MLKMKTQGWDSPTFKLCNLVFGLENVLSNKCSGEMTRVYVTSFSVFRTEATVSIGLRNVLREHLHHHLSQPTHLGILA